MKPRDILQKYWGFADFRGSQLQIIETVIEGRDVLALLPTGGGKSACFQVPALASEGICIVVSPLIALIQDQIAALKQKGIKALALTGGLKLEELVDRLDNCQYGSYKFLYLSPERLQQSLVQERISQMNVNLLAIDEAHCISQWGHDFRPAYLDCAILRELKPEVPMIALTATATREVAKEIIDNLRLREPRVFKDSFRRPNIAYHVIAEEDKAYRLNLWCSKIKGSGIVYVRTRRMAEELAALLSRNGSTAAFYHGGLVRKEKTDTLARWMAGKVPYMVATSAFGMGVDKPDVRLVIHYQIPDSIESYYQEAGRAGRDGLPAYAVLLCNPADEIQLKNQFLDTLPDIPFIKALYRNLSNYFQIPYGTGENLSFNFHFNHFCETYKLNGTLAYNALQVLDQNSVISLSPQFKRKIEVRFKASKAQLWHYLENQDAMAPSIQVLLRTYGGIFDYDTKINTLLLARKAGTTEDSILALLEKLQKDEIIDYKAQHGDLEITFLVPREDELTINHFAPLVQKYQQVRQHQVDKVLKYINNDSRCRTRQLLEYFGEKTKSECGQCDVCTGKKKGKQSDLTNLMEEILQLLHSRPLTSRVLIDTMGMDEASVLKALQLLLETGQIRMGNKNEYRIA